MSWRTGSKLFLEIWPAILANITDREARIEFTARLLQMFSEEDMDTWDVEDAHPDIRAALRRSGLGVAEPGRYKDDPE